MNDSSPKSLLLVTRNLPPLVGGMEKLNLHICRALSTKFKVSVAGPEGSSAHHQCEQFVEFSVKPLWKFILASCVKTLRLALRIRPSVIFCGSGATILAGFFAAKLTGARLVCYLHGLDIIVDSKVYQQLFIPLIKRADLLLVNSNHTRQLAIDAGILVKKLVILHPGTHLPDITRRDDAVKRFRHKFQLNNVPFVLIAGRVTKRKGIAEFIENVMPSIVAACCDVQLVVVGEEAREAMKQSLGVQDNIESVIARMNLTNNVKLIGGVDDETLSDAFFAANVLAFPVLNIPNDVEGFGMIAIEAAAHGLPTVGFAVGGIPDAISHGQSGWLVESGNYQAMADLIMQRILPYDDGDVTAASCINYASKYEWSCFGEGLFNILDR